MLRSGRTDKVAPPSISQPDETSDRRSLQRPNLRPSRHCAKRSRRPRNRQTHLLSLRSRSIIHLRSLGFEPPAPSSTRDERPLYAPIIVSPSIAGRPPRTRDKTQRTLGAIPLPTSRPATLERPNARANPSAAHLPPQANADQSTPQTAGRCSASRLKASNLRAITVERPIETDGSHCLVVASQAIRSATTIRCRLLQNQRRHRR